MKRNPPDLFLFTVTMFLLAIGLIIVTSASAPESLNLTHGKSALYFGAKQFLFAVIGLGAMLFMMKFPYRNIKRLTVPIFLITLFTLILVLFIATAVKGSKRWINIGFFVFQPSELAKLSIIFFLAHYMSEIKKGITNFWIGVMIPLFVVGLFCGLILLEPDLGTAMVIFVTFMMMLFVSGARMLHMNFLGGLGLSLGTVLVIAEPYRLQRLFAFIDPWKDARGDGWQIIQSLFALGSGGPFGLGLGMGRQKFDYLPEAHTDYIFSILGEELGLMGTAAVITLFFLLAWRGYKIAISTQDPYARLLAAGITSYLIFQAVLNIGVVTSSIPVTGITLPFLSSGGSSLIISLMSVGILLNISKYAE
jgi:cell division protein FtsW